MKRDLLVAVSAAVVVMAALALLRNEPHLAAERPNAPAAVEAADVPMPIQFRQNQPRHWRYVMLSQSR